MGCKNSDQGKILPNLKLKNYQDLYLKEKNIWLAFSPIKKIPQDLMIQKTTELGIQKIYSIIM